MSKYDFFPTIQQALQRAEKQKIQYEKNLLGRSFVYIYVDKHNTITSINVEFQKKNFLHLTGLDYKQRQQLKRSGSISEMKIATNAEEFYDRLGTDSKLISDVSFIQDQTQAETDLYYKYTQYKLHNLSQITSIASKACYIGKYKGAQDFDVIVNKSLNFT